MKKVEAVKQPKLKKFNKVIQIEVSVDKIAEKLLEEFKEDSPHKEIITNSIIGNLMEEGKISDLYNSLNGWETNLDFEVGNIIAIEPNTCNVYGYWTNQSIDKEDDVHGSVLFGEITQINEYAKRYTLTISIKRPWLVKGKIEMKTTSATLNHQHATLADKETMDVYNDSLENKLNNYITLKNKSEQAAKETEENLEA